MYTNTINSCRSLSPGPEHRTAYVDPLHGVVFALSERTCLCAYQINDQKLRVRKGAGKLTENGRGLHRNRTFWPCQAAVLERRKMKA